ncbi:FAD-binding domain-containing protein [Ceratobasidium sp. AG-I]|nr:FAD-binding domain-containing protein [Ceratobasidium sp. AG-I]
MSQIDTSSLALLRCRLSAEASVSLAGEHGYNVKRWAENAEKPAAAVACPANAHDVAELLAFVQGRSVYKMQNRLDLAIKGGGHSASGASSTNGGLVIDLQPHMNNVRIDPENKLAYVGGGALWEQVDRAAVEYGLAPVAGVVSHTGVGILTLGGGRGWLTGEHGLVIDNMVGATVITSASEILEVSEAKNPDLFWAIRGGGGNFGVITEFLFRLHPQRDTVFHHFFVFSPRSLGRLVEELNSWIKYRNTNENGSLAFALCPERKPVIVLQLIYNGDSREGSEKYQRFVRLGPMMHRPETIPYIRLNQLQNAQSKHGENKLFRGNFIPATPIGLPLPVLASLFDNWHDFVTNNPTAWKSNVLIELYHPDRVASVTSDATAFAFRQPNYAVLLTMHWIDPAFTPQASKASVQIDTTFEHTRDAAFSAASNMGGTYINYLDEDSRAGASKTQSKFGPNYVRLVEIKQKYDPQRVFGKWFAILDPRKVPSTCAAESTAGLGATRQKTVVES